MHQPNPIGSRAWPVPACDWMSQSAGRSQFTWRTKPHDGTVELRECWRLGREWIVQRAIESKVDRSCGPEITKEVATTSRLDRELNVRARLKC
jgi:hypothetical protein